MRDQVTRRSVREGIGGNVKGVMGREKRTSRLRAMKLSGRPEGSEWGQLLVPTERA